MTKRILLVEDNAYILHWLRCMIELDYADCEVTTATDGIDAWEHVERQPFDLVVADYRMPIMDGLRLLEQVREHDPQTAVVLLTADDSPAVRQEAERLQIDGYVLKPVDRAEFSQVLARVWSAECGPVDQIRGPWRFWYLLEVTPHFVTPRDLWTTPSLYLVGDIEI